MPAPEGRGLDLDQAFEVGDAGQCSRAIPQDYLSSWPNAREMQMSDNPIDIIEAAIRAAFTSYPKEDDPDWRSPHWIKPEECVHLAQSILLELQAKGFEIVKKRT